MTTQTTNFQQKFVRSIRISGWPDTPPMGVRGLEKIEGYPHWFSWLDPDSG